MHWKALNCLCTNFLNQRSNTYQCAVLSVCTLYWILPRYFFFFLPLLSLATVVGSTSSFFKSSSVSDRFCKDLWNHHSVENIYSWVPNKRRGNFPPTMLLFYTLRLLIMNHVSIKHVYSILQLLSKHVHELKKMNFK